VTVQIASDFSEGKVSGKAREGALGCKVNGKAKEGALGCKVNGKAKEGALGRKMKKRRLLL
jgi:hypothetical protein